MTDRWANGQMTPHCRSSEGEREALPIGAALFPSYVRRSSEDRDERTRVGVRLVLRCALALCLSAVENEKTVRRQHQLEAGAGRVRRHSRSLGSEGTGGDRTEAAPYLSGLPVAGRQARRSGPAP